MNTLSPDLELRRGRLLDRLRSYGRMALAYSGGVDSTLLARAALEALGPGEVLGVLARSPSYPEAELQEALRTAEAMGLPWRILDTRELEDPRYAANPAERCRYCKQELFTRMRRLADELGFPTLAYGSIAEDRGDHRPGREAALEHGVCAPLEEEGFSKEELRALSRAWGLPTWDKPSFACLASRIPYGEAIDRPKLARIEAAEDFLRRSGFRQFRVRHHGDLARLEVEVEDLPRLVEPSLRARLVARLRELGFRYVTMDLAGFRSGSMNEVLESGGGRAPRS